MPTVWWMGRGSSNTIRPEDWAAHDIVAGSVVWDASNGWSVDEATLTSDQIAVLAASHDYLTGQTGPRAFPSPSPGGNFEDFVRSAYAYFIAIKAMYDAWLAGGGGGPGGGPENTDELDEGSTNLYFTDARADARADIRAAAAISNLIGAAPAELDTWIELVSQISANEDAIAGIVSSISGKQDADADLTWLAGNLSAFARTLLDDPDAATALATLGAVARTATASRIYGTDASGVQGAFAFAGEASTPNTFPFRGASGTFQVGVPTHASHPARKTDLDAVGKVLSRVDYTGGPSTVQYFEIARLPADSSGNAASVTLRGRLGGWTPSSDVAEWSILLSNRTVTYTGLTVGSSVIVQGPVSFAAADIEVYSQADKTAIIYLKATGYYGIDMRGSATGYSSAVGSVNFITTPTTPTGTKIWALSTAPRLETNASGQLVNPRISQILDANGATAFGFSTVANAVNSLYASGNVAGSTPFIKAQGSDTNINIALAPKGSGLIRLQDGNWVDILRLAGVANAVNHLYIYNAAANGSPAIQALGSDSNISINLQPKGTGSVAVNGVSLADIISLASYLATLTGSSSRFLYYVASTKTWANYSSTSYGRGFLSLNDAAAAAAYLTDNATKAEVTSLSNSVSTALNGKADKPTGTPNGSKFFRDDGTWALPDTASSLNYLVWVGNLDTGVGNWPAKPANSLPTIWVGGVAPDNFPAGHTAGDMWFPARGDWLSLGQSIDLIQSLTPAPNKIPFYSAADAAAFLDLKTETNLASNSDTAVPSQKAVKAYVDSLKTYVDGLSPVGAKQAYDTYANMMAANPATLGAGYIWRCSNIDSVYRSNGTSWVLVSSGGGIGGMDPTALSGWSWANQGTATITETDGSLLLTCPAVNGTTDTLRIRRLPITGVTTITGKIDWHLTLSNGPGAYFGFTDGTKFKLWGFQMQGYQTFVFMRQNWNTTTSINGTVNISSGAAAVYLAQRKFWRIFDTGTNHLFQLSTNGLEWETVDTISRSDFIASPNYFCYGMNTYGSGYTATMRVRQLALT